jgi:hypothetical protein
MALGINLPALPAACNFYRLLRHKMDSCLGTQRNHYQHSRLWCNKQRRHSRNDLDIKYHSWYHYPYIRETLYRQASYNLRAKSNRSSDSEPAILAILALDIPASSQPMLLTLTIFKTYKLNGGDVAALSTLVPQSVTTFW